MRMNDATLDALWRAALRAYRMHADSLAARAMVTLTERALSGDDDCLREADAVATFVQAFASETRTRRTVDPDEDPATEPSPEDYTGAEPLREE